VGFSVSGADSKGVPMKKVLLLSALCVVALCCWSQSVQAQSSQPLFDTRFDYFVEGGGPNSLAAGDFNGDGIVDIAASGSFGAKLTIFAGNGNGTFRNIGKVPGELNGTIVAKDFNNDKKLDIAIATLDSVYIALGNGDGTFKNPIGQSVKSSRQLVAEDFNKDGKIDLNSFSQILCIG
jgi:hypothetical protein